MIKNLNIYLFSFLVLHFLTIQKASSEFVGDWDLLPTSEKISLSQLSFNNFFNFSGLNNMKPNSGKNIENLSFRASFAKKYRNILFFDFFSGQNKFNNLFDNNDNKNYLYGFNLSLVKPFTRNYIFGNQNIFQIKYKNIPNFKVDCIETENHIYVSAQSSCSSTKTRVQSNINSIYDFSASSLGILYGLREKKSGWRNKSIKSIALQTNIVNFNNTFYEIDKRDGLNLNNFLPPENIWYSSILNFSYRKVISVIGDMYLGYNFSAHLPKVYNYENKSNIEGLEPYFSIGTKITKSFNNIFISYDIKYSSAYPIHDGIINYNHLNNSNQNKPSFLSEIKIGFINNHNNKLEEPYSEISNLNLKNDEIIKKINSEINNTNYSKIANSEIKYQNNEKSNTEKNKILKDQHLIEIAKNFSNVYDNIDNVLLLFEKHKID